MNCEWKLMKKIERWKNSLPERCLLTKIQKHEKKKMENVAIMSRANRRKSIDSQKNHQKVFNYKETK